MLENKNLDRRNLWQGRWGYAESIIIGSGLFIIGFCLELFNNQANAFSLHFPGNLIFLLGFIVILVLLQVLSGKSAAIVWISSIPASITSIVLVGIPVMMMGIIPQVESSSEIINRLKLNNMLGHWAFILSMLFFLSSLGMVIIRRFKRVAWSDWGFMMNHLGLFIALFAGLIGSGDMQRLSVETYEGKYSWQAFDNRGKSIDLPFAIYLEDFIMEEFSPKLALIDNETGELVEEAKGNLALIESESGYRISDFEVTVKKYLKSSGAIGDRFEPVNEPGSPPSALLDIRTSDGGSITEGWISCGSFRHPYKSLKIDEKVSMVMTIPEPKNFRSDVRIISEEDEMGGIKLEVNKPYKYKGWKIYQAGYEERMGRWSEKSVIEVIRDPWLPVVYAGIFMMIAGALQLIWKGNKRRIQNG